ncbi:MAG TPA: hypothetical protein VE868_13875 [Balneolaceae bacterium]|nr:hypothetical protein [Balneolaceae bacterium]
MNTSRKHTYLFSGSKRKGRSPITSRFSSARSDLYRRQRETKPTV